MPSSISPRPNAFGLVGGKNSRGRNNNVQMNVGKRSPIELEARRYQVRLGRRAVRCREV